MNNNQIDFLSKSQNFNQNFFVMGRIGNTEIVKQTIEAFTNSLVDEVWTNITAYKPAQPVEIKTLFGSNMSNSQGNTNLSRSLDLKNIIVDESKSKIEDFRQLRTDIENRKSQSNDLILKEKNYMINNIIKDRSLNANTSPVEISKKIKENLKNVYMSSDSLTSKLAKFHSYFNNLPGQGQTMINSTTDVKSEFSLFGDDKKNNNNYLNTNTNPQQFDYSKFVSQSSSSAQNTNTNYINNSIYNYNPNTSVNSNNSSAPSYGYGYGNNQTTSNNVTTSSNNNYYNNNPNQSGQTNIYGTNMYGGNTSMNNSSPYISNQNSTYNQSNQNPQNTQQNYNYGIGYNTSTDPNKKNYN